MWLRLSGDCITPFVFIVFPSHAFVLFLLVFCVVAMSRARSLLIILDLNGALLQRVIQRPKIASISSFEHRKAEKYHIYLRPHFHAFMSYLIREFEVAVWTSAQENNALAIVKECFTDSFIPEKLQFVWHREHCELRNRTSQEVAAIKAANPKAFVKPIAIKDLDAVWKAYGDRYSPNNTLILDDSAEKMRHRDNHLFIPSFQVTEDALNDESLVILTEYLTKLKIAAEGDDSFDVRRYVSSHPIPYADAKREAL